MKINYFSILLLTCIFIFTSCKKQPINTSKVDQADIQAFKVEELNFEYLTAKAKISYQDQNNDLNANVNLRVKKDSIIWISLTPALGIEVSRCLITKDSLYLLDRLNNHFYQYDFVTLGKKFNMNITFNLLESAFIGNLPYPKKQTDSLSKFTKDDYYLLQQKEGNLHIENYVKMATMKLERLKVSEFKAHKELQIVYSDFRPLGNFLFAYNNFVHLTFLKNSKIESTAISIEFNKVEFPDKPLNFPFNIPAKFTRKQ